MTKRITIAIIICGFLSACGIPRGPEGSMNTEAFVANSLKQYGVLDGRRVEQAAPDHAM